MPSLEDIIAPEDATEGLDFSVISQKVDLELDFSRQAISGSTQLVVQPHTKDLNVFRLNCRQCRITRVTVEGKPAPISYNDPYDKISVRRRGGNIHQHDFLKSKVAPHVREVPEPELQISLPPRVTVKELDTSGGYTAARPATLKRKESENGPLETPILQEIELGPRFAPIRIYIDFKVESFRDGLHWVGIRDGDGRFPHVYTRNSLTPGVISSVFPCLDHPNSRCMWEISITCPKTLGDAFRKSRVNENSDIQQIEGTNGVRSKAEDYSIILSEDERALDLNVVCSGELVDDRIDASDPTRRTVSFACATSVCPRHIGFAVGPFEQVDLSAEFRQADEDEKLGQSATKVLGYCLPGRADELRNTCLPMTKAIDHFTILYGSFPFPNYRMCFVDDLTHSFGDAAGLSICSNRLLFPEEIIDTLDPNTRSLVLALANQYIGVNIIPKAPTDLWAVVGVAGFMADMFMKKLAGNNEYRFRQKMAADSVFEQDVDRYSVHQLGDQLDIDPSEFEFLQLKSALILFILDRRLTKQSGSTGMNRIITRIFLNAKTGDLNNGELTTENFLRICEKLGHAKLDSFFKQWVYNAGCPDFMVTQKFNKKKLVVEMTIQQMQTSRPRRLDVRPSTFMREAKEQVSEAYAPETQPAFVGPMTIRIHEADGTPYEHIVEIKDVTTRFEIPYNTKYKRLKRSRKAKERAIAVNGPEQVGDSQDDVLLYCLGDVLQSEQEVKDWFLADWTEQQENQMGQESYEWIRMDADFEWIGRMNLNMPIYMYVSQLQQDRDVVAQYESVQRIAAQDPHQMGSTILIRTLMDKRYFHGIRTAAATGLTKLAVPSVRYLGLYHLDKAFCELYCYPDNPTMPRPNDFLDRASYIVQCTIPQAMATVRDPEGRMPLQVRKFLFDKIKFNDNSHNENNGDTSDCFYIAILTRCLIEAVVSLAKIPQSFAFSFDDDEKPVDTEEELFKTQALNELERYRNSDEWTPSYQNATTVTAISCLQRLVASGVATHKIADLVTYSRSDHADNVRLKAFQALANLGMMNRPAMMRYLIDTMTVERSPYIRAELSKTFGYALGLIATGSGAEEKSLAVDMDVDSGLVLEQDPVTDARQQDIARKSSPEGAIQALKSQMEHDDVFKAVMWEACLSTELSLPELSSLLDVAALIFEPSSIQGSLVISLPYPRYWQAKHIGGGKMRFSKTGRFRTKPSKSKPLSQKDTKLVKENSLVYTGPKVKATPAPAVQPQPAAVTTAQAKEAQLAAQIAAVQKELQRQQGIPIKNAKQMSPGPAVTVTEASQTTNGIKLSLKRKSSVDLGRALSPKVPKTGKIQTASAATPLSITATGKASSPPRQKATGSASPSVPKKAGQKPKATKSRVVKLRFPSKVNELQDILLGSARQIKPEPVDGTIRVATVSDGYFPAMSGTGSTGVNGSAAAEAPALASWNMGGFRNFSVSSASPGPPIKTEAVETNGAPAAAIQELPPSSPDDIPLALAQKQREASAAASQASINGGGGNDSSHVADDRPRPPPPVRKITLKFGKKAGGAQSPT